MVTITEGLFATEASELMRHAAIIKLLKIYGNSQMKFAGMVMIELYANGQKE